MHLRRFVLEPLAELAPSLLHPTLQQTIGALLENLDDQAAVRLWRANRDGETR
jgi:2-amino-4-hydroxy-6-hydroxymethyldihydropteridine diphosphokinase